MPEVATSNHAFKIIAINPEGALFHLVGQELGQRLSIPKEIHDLWQPKVGGWVDFEPIACDAVRGQYGAVAAVYREDLLPNTAGDFDGDQAHSVSAPAAPAIDFSRLDRMMEYSNNQDQPDALCLFNSLRVFTQRYGGNYAAVLLQNADHEDGAYEALSGDYGFEHHLQARPWFPYRTAGTATEAIVKLLAFINNELTTDREKLINWSVNCAELEYDLAKGGDGYYDIAPEWKLTLEEAYVH